MSFVNLKVNKINIQINLPSSFKRSKEAHKIYMCIARDRFEEYEDEEKEGNLSEGIINN